MFWAATTASTGPRAQEGIAGWESHGEGHDLQWPVNNVVSVAKMSPDNSYELYVIREFLLNELRPSRVLAPCVFDADRQ